MKKMNFLRSNGAVRRRWKRTPLHCHTCAFFSFTLALHFVLILLFIVVYFRYFFLLDVRIQWNNEFSRLLSGFGVYEKKREISRYTHTLNKRIMHTVALRTQKKVVKNPEREMRNKIVVWTLKEGSLCDTLPSFILLPMYAYITCIEPIVADSMTVFPIHNSLSTLYALYCLLPVYW